MRSDSPRLRIAIIGVVAISLFAALFARLWYLQVLASSEFQIQATALQRRVVDEPAPRGRILDRNGEVLVDNELSFVASLDRQVLRGLDDDEQTAIFDRLVDELRSFEPTITKAVLEHRLASERYSPYRPVPVAEGIPEELAVYLTEHEDEFLGALHVESKAVRTYPFGQLAAHVLGYVGSINDEEYDSLRESPLRYQLSDEIGKGGVEQSMESLLRGQPGRRVLEVDADNNTVQELPGSSEPVAGNDVYLSIDVRVQAVAEEALLEELERARDRRMSDGRYQTAPAGSVVVLDPRDGSVLAMASYPTFRPGDLTDGIDDVEWDALNTPEAHYPLINRTIQGEYAPGSTFKLVTAYAGLESGAIRPQDTIPDGGTFRVPSCEGGTCTFNNAGSVAHGPVDLVRAMTVSSDVYFYQLGARFWIERGSYGDPIQESANLFGFGADSEIPLANERSGWIPTPENSLARYEENPEAFPYGNEWYTGHNVNISVGQGDVVATPLQLANAYATIANGGDLLVPSIAREAVPAGGGDPVWVSERQITRTIPFAPGWRESLMAGFTGVTQDGEGTAVGTFADFPNWIVAGKTGTAEVDGLPGELFKADTSLFVGMAPAEAPQYVGAAILEESGFGGQAAAPLIRRIFESIADPALTPIVVSDPTSPVGYTLSIPLPEAANPLTSGDLGG